jgi:hypothetical protein
VVSQIQVVVITDVLALTAILALFLNLILPEEIEDEEIPDITADVVDVDADNREWGRLHSVSGPRKASHDEGIPPKSESHENGIDIEKSEMASAEQHTVV